MATVKFVQARKTTLHAAITSGETSAIILKRLVDIYGNELSLSDFGDIIYLTLNPGGTTEEIISATGFTRNSDDTVTLNTGIVRGLAAKSPYASGGTAQDHAAGVAVVVSNNPQIYNSLVHMTGAQTIAGIKTFSSLPATTAGNPVADNDLVRKAYADAILAGGSGIPNRIVVAGTAGATVADGNHVYFDTTDNEWKLVDADSAATLDDVLTGIAQGAGVDGAAISGGVLLWGLDDAQSGMTIGDIMYASNTAGGVSATPGTVEMEVGIAKSATELYYMPRFMSHPTAKQKDILEKLLAGTHLYAADAGSTDTYAITLAPVPSAYTAGMLVRFKANTRNTGACTINVNALGAVSIKKEGNLDLADGDIEAGGIYLIVHDGTNFQLMNPRGSVPTGSMMMFMAATAPTGYLLCDGSAVSRTTYAALFAVIGTTYGTGDGSTTFNLPNMKSRFPYGLDAADTANDTLGETGGSKTHTLTIAEMPAHTHAVGEGAGNGTTGVISMGVGATGGGTTTGSTGGGGAHENRPPFLTVNFIIKH